MTRRRTLCAWRSALTAALVCIAAVPGCGEPDPPPYYVLLDTGSGVLRVPCVEIEGASSGRVFRLLSASERIAHGRSGSPLYTSSGKILGGVNAYIGSSGELFSIQPIERIRRALERARSGLRSELPDLLETQETPRAVEPGQSIAFLWTWGDINLGIEGTVTEVEGRWVTAFAHAVGNDVGPVLGFLAESRAITEVLGGTDARTLLAEPTRIVGSFVWIAAESGVGILGRYPERTAVKIVWPGWPEWDKRFETVRPWKHGRTAIWKAAHLALEPLRLLRGSALGEAQVSISFNGERRTFALETLRSAADEGLDKCVIQRVLSLGDRRFGAGASRMGPATLDIAVSLAIQRHVVRR